MKTDRAALGRALIIANPAAHSGEAGAAAERLQRFLDCSGACAAGSRLVYTERPRHATELARASAGFDTVLALGGDGVVNEVASGLMDLPGQGRPRLGVVPVGSGNDYARTLGIPHGGKLDAGWLLSCTPEPVDVGRIELLDDGGQGGAPRYFVETFSVGLDAAIALGTQELRESTPLTGTALYLASSLSVLGARYRRYPARVSIDGAEPEARDLLLMAVQLGPTYGSGFRSCPEADPADGLFDTCYAAGRIPRAAAVPVFLRAKGGHHTGSRLVTMGRARRVEFWFDGDDYPIQADGELVRASHVAVEVVPGALTVLRPRSAS